MKDQAHAHAVPAVGTGTTGADLLGIYLNDHLAGATAGTERARSLAGALQGSPSGPALRTVAQEIGEDRASLLAIMDMLGVPVRHYKVSLAWAAERVGRLKSNGRLVGRSPLTSLVELEFLRLAVQGKAAAWQTLRRLADTDGRLDARLLDELLERAERQQATLEELRLGQVTETFRPS
ncbi:hypothetical protein [Streptomyces chromofuscus]|uniref:Uncharacterized protein n=1 Tax=Streptomyces chromofuscus TaxID=42881 RepID=A0A7M2T5U6_STRCW|nr:hypothetical protein [Streptomyces chromofuscus]QOV44060.1 hypothetical protein IPT68_31110 [Streptomyces chromofuscus]GGT05930.1 hypothetical protein GCM10010254_27940 [Streptomyces chromofuscus]